MVSEMFYFDFLDLLSDDSMRFNIGYIDMFIDGFDFDVLWICWNGFFID